MRKMYSPKKRTNTQVNAREINNKSDKSFVARAAGARGSFIRAGASSALQHATSQSDARTVSRGVATNVQSTPSTDVTLLELALHLQARA